MTSFFIFMIACLATYRISMLFSVETGPWGLFEKIRNLPAPDSYLRKGLGCMFCETVWWGFIFSFWLMILGGVPFALFPIYWLSVSAGAILIDSQWPQE